MNIRHPATQTLLSLILSTAPLFAQITYNGCRDTQGTPVASLRDTSINDIAVARTDNGAPTIHFNPTVVASVAPQTRLFFYAHECAHHALGHLLTGLRLGQEQDADCWGIQTLTQSGLLSDSDISVIQQQIWQLGRGDWTHLPGPQRAINLRACLNQTGQAAGGNVQTVVVPCTHPLHPNGDLTACTHPAHSNGDLIPCSHPCPGPFGTVPCHRADVVPCTHALHPLGDLVPCSHPAHPNGDVVPRSVR